MNPFEQLCLLASAETWCWNLYCTTCGHLHFRYSFSELAAGESPANADWLVHRRRTNYTKQLGPLPKRYSDEQKVKILEICSQADLSFIGDRCKAPDWLGYLGLVLEHRKCDNNAYRTVSSQWAEQLRDLAPPRSLIYSRLNEIASNDHEQLNIEDLEQIEFSSRLGISVPGMDYDPDYDSPEARANFATRHILKLPERRRRRDELLKKFQSEEVVDMFPGKPNQGPEDG